MHWSYSALSCSVMIVLKGGWLKRISVVLTPIPENASTQHKRMNQLVLNNRRNGSAKKIGF